MAEIRNFRTLNEKKKKEDVFFKTLRLQAKLSQQAEEAVGDQIEGQQLNITPVAPKRRPVSEELQDYQAQRQLAFENLLSLKDQGITPTAAEAIINNLGDSNNFDNLVLLNNQWKTISDIAKKQRNLDDAQFRRIFDKYRERFGQEGLEESSIKAEDVVRELEASKELPRAAQAILAPGSNIVIPNDVRTPSRDIANAAFRGNNWSRSVTNPYIPGQPQAGDPDAQRKALIWNMFAKYTKPDIFKIVTANVRNRNADYNANFNLGLDPAVPDEVAKARNRFRQLQTKEMVPKIIDWMVDNDYYFNQDPAMLGYGMNQAEPKHQNQKLHRKGSSSIVLHREGNRRIIGRGIAPNPKPRYAELGKLIIHVPSLNKGILNIKYRSKSNVTGLPQQTISSDMQDFLLDTLEHGAVNQSLFKKLSREDQKLFVKIGGTAQIDDGLGYRSILDEDEKKEMDRFNLVKGIFLAGNNSKEVVQEIQGFLRKFLHENKISRSEGLELLQEIASLV